MVVGENDPCRVVAQRRLHHLARIYAGLGQGTAEKLLRTEQAVLRVELCGAPHNSTYVQCFLMCGVPVEATGSVTYRINSPH
jgi:hypothetical protein